MKSIMLLMIVCGWWHKAVAQSQGGLEQYYYMYNKTATTLTPIIWYQTKKGWYVEGRYNYEADKTLSVYVGKTFEKESTVSYAVTPLIGVLAGEYKGLSIGANTDLKYKKIFFSLQSQYTFSLQDRSTNFIFNWADLGYKVSTCFSAGLSLQQTNLYRTRAVSEKGIFIKASFGRWEVPLYFFNPAKNEKYTVLGLNFSLQSKNETRHSMLYL